jgi:hypothetical protein
MLSKEHAQIHQPTSKNSQNREFYDWLDLEELEEFIKADDGSVCLVEFWRGIGKRVRRRKEEERGGRED